MIEAGLHTNFEDVRNFMQEFLKKMQKLVVCIREGRGACLDEVQGDSCEAKPEYVSLRVALESLPTEMTSILDAMNAQLDLIDKLLYSTESITTPPPERCCTK